MLPLSPKHALQMRRERLDVCSDTLSVGLNFMDRLLGGGFQRGTFLEITGDEGSGKTTLALQMTAGVQAQGRHCLWVDAERSFNSQYARQLGVDTDSLLMAGYEDGDFIMRLLAEFVASDEVELIVVDTLSALPSYSDLKSISDPIGTHTARIRKWVQWLAKQKPYGRCCVVFLSQLRDVPVPEVGNMSVSASGRLDDFCEMSIALEKKQPLCQDGVRIGTEIDVRVIRNLIGGHPLHSIRPLVVGRGFIDEMSDSSTPQSDSSDSIYINAPHRPSL